MSPACGAQIPPVFAVFVCVRMRTQAGGTPRSDPRKHTLTHTLVRIHTPGEAVWVINSQHASGEEAAELGSPKSSAEVTVEERY